MEFKIKNEQMVQHYLKKVVELINTNKSIDGSNIILFDRYRYAITYYVIFNRKIPNSEIGPIIRGSLLNLKQYDNQNLLENFKIELNQQSDDFFQKKLIKYYLVIPTNFKSDTIRINISTCSILKF